MVQTSVHGVLVDAQSADSKYHSKIHTTYKLWSQYMSGPVCAVTCNLMSIHYVRVSVSIALADRAPTLQNSTKSAVADLVRRQLDRRGKCGIKIAPEYKLRDGK